MPDLLAVATLKSTSGLGENDVVNTFAFSTPSGSAVAQAPDIVTEVQSFYNDSQTTGTRRVSQYLSSSLSRGTDQCRVQVYDITGKTANVERLNAKGQTIVAPPVHGSPIYEDGFTLFAPAAHSRNLPEEVALVVTLRGVSWSTVPVESPDSADLGTATDRPRARRTGRLYIGPFIEAAHEMETTTNHSRPIADMRVTLLEACSKMATDIDTRIPGARWCVWSRADGFLHTIVEAQVDNAWDTQRRRGVSPTLRTTGPVHVV